ncbi:OsmC family protein [Cellulomonas sp. NPDC089187]|uniref:OsmC family protein n=1 Tax=Cellulomonas sp. NPDC089187 TaxID=3154970 RepID=UPI0034330FC1
MTEVQPANAAGTRLWVERTGTRTYTGRNSRGAEVAIGPVEGGAVFTPGELLKVALAGCSGMSADHAIAHRLGDDVAVTLDVEGPTHPTEDRYPQLHERLVVDLSGLDDAAKERLLRVVHRAVDEHCTVGRTLTAGAEVTLDVVQP